MKKLLICLMALVVLFSVSALADVTVESSTTLERSTTLCEDTNCYYTRTDVGYQLFDADGHALSAAYGSMYPRQSGLYIEVQNANGLNVQGLLDAQGNEILPLIYGDFEFINDDWVLAYVLEATSEDTGEYKDADGNKYVAGRTDVVYKGRIIGSLTRADYIKSYSVSARGAYLCVKIASGHCYWLDSSFNRLDVTDDGYVSTAEFYDFSKTGVLHNPTQQYAFTSGCTLTANQVEQTVWYDSKTGSLLGLQGNVLASNLTYDYAYFRQNALCVKRNQLEGILSLDGREIVPPQYKEIAYSDEGYFASGYTAAVDSNGRLSYFDENGNVTASVSYELSSYDYKGFIYNAPIMAVKNMGKYIIITATNGELPTMYDDFSTCGARQRIISVKQGDVWGCIDMDGNTVIPFVHKNAPDISADGTLVVGYTTERKYMVYRLSYGDAPAASASTNNWTETRTSGENVDSTPVLAEGAWQCTCGTITNGKFCPDCGRAKPEPTATPAADGSWTCSCGSVNTGNFCPNCGSKKPEAAPQCQNCGYKPEGTVPNFCPECGSKF